MRRELAHAGWLRLLLITGVAGGVTGAALLGDAGASVQLSGAGLLLLATLLFWQGRAVGLAGAATTMPSTAAGWRWAAGWSAYGGFLAAAWA